MFFATTFFGGIIYATGIIAGSFSGEIRQQDPRSVGFTIGRVSFH